LSCRFTYHYGHSSVAEILDYHVPEAPNNLAIRGNHVVVVNIEAVVVCDVLGTPGLEYLSLGGLQRSSLFTVLLESFGQALGLLLSLLLRKKRIEEGPEKRK
jgi:hypothetical protein